MTNLFIKKPTFIIIRSCLGAVPVCGRAPGLVPRPSCRPPRKPPLIINKSPKICNPCNKSPKICNPCNKSPKICNPCNKSPKICNPCNKSPKICNPCNKSPKICNQCNKSPKICNPCNKSPNNPDKIPSRSKCPPPSQCYIVLSVLASAVGGQVGGAGSSWHLWGVL